MNTNQETRMDKERIAELRLHEKHLRASGQMVGACLGECLDALESAQAELAALRGQRQASEVAFGAWFETHFADWLRAMRGGFRHDDIQQFRDSLLTAWSAALRGQVGGVAPELTDEEVDAYVWDRNHGLVDSDEDWVRWSRRVGRWAYALAVSRLSVIPSSREATGWAR